MTAMGGRLLKQWIDRPLLSIDAIEQRLNSVDTLKNHYMERQELREKLKQVYDIERLAGRVAFGNVNARDLVSLKTTLWQIPDIIHILQSISDPEMQRRAKNLDPCTELADMIDRAIIETPPLSVKEGESFAMVIMTAWILIAMPVATEKYGSVKWKRMNGKRQELSR